MWKAWSIILRGSRQTTKSSRRHVNQLAHVSSSRLRDFLAQTHVHEPQESWRKESDRWEGSPATGGVIFVLGAPTDRGVARVPVSPVKGGFGIGVSLAERGVASGSDAFQMNDWMKDVLKAKTSIWSKTRTSTRCLFVVQHRCAYIKHCEF